jgi:hypothetical protein
VIFNRVFSSVVLVRGFRLSVWSEIVSLKAWG